MFSVDYCNVIWLLWVLLASWAGNMKAGKNPLVFLDVSIDGDATERLVIEVTEWFWSALDSIDGFSTVIDVYSFALFLNCFNCVQCSCLRMLSPRLLKIFVHSALVNWIHASFSLPEISNLLYNDWNTTLHSPRHCASAVPHNVKYISSIWGTHSAKFKVIDIRL